MADELTTRLKSVKPGETITYYTGQSGRWQSFVSPEAREIIVTARDMNLAHFVQKSLGGGVYDYMLVWR